LNDFDLVNLMRKTGDVEVREIFRRIICFFPEVGGRLWISGEVFDWREKRR
jgi:hypothetical protein